MIMMVRTVDQHTRRAIDNFPLFSSKYGSERVVV